MDTLGIAIGLVLLSGIVGFSVIVGLMALVFIGTTSYLWMLLLWRYYQARHAIMYDLLGRYAAGKLERVDIRYEDEPGYGVHRTTFVAVAAKRAITISISRYERAGDFELTVEGDSHVLGGQLCSFLNAFQAHTNRRYAVFL